MTATDPQNLLSNYFGNSLAASVDRLLTGTFRLNRQILCIASSNVRISPVRRGEERAESKGKAPDLAVALRFQSSPGHSAEDGWTDAKSLRCVSVSSFSLC